MKLRNHGAPALQRFIDRIHEMIRKNPISEVCKTFVYNFAFNNLNLQVKSISSSY